MKRHSSIETETYQMRQNVLRLFLCEGYSFKERKTELFTTVFVHMQMESNWRKGNREGVVQDFHTSHTIR